MAESKVAKKFDKAIIYTTPTCVFCKAVKEYLTDKGIEYETIDVSADAEKAQEMIDRSGQMGVPVTILADEVVVGFNKPKLDQILAAK